MRKILSILSTGFIFLISIFLLASNTQAQTPFTLGGPIINGNNTVFSIQPPAGTNSTLAIIETGYVSPIIPNGATSVTWTAPGSGTYTAVLLFTTVEISNRARFTITGGGGGGNAAIGTINPGQSVPSVSGDPSAFVASLIRNSISLLIIVAFILDLIWTIIGGIRFITAGGDPKTTGAAWSQIYWGMIGMVVVVGSFAIIKLVEIFFSVSIISGGFRLPTI